MAQKQPASLAVNTAVFIFSFVAQMGHDQRSSEPPAPPSLGEAAPGRRRGRRRRRGRGPGVSVRTRGFSPRDTRAVSCPLAGSAGPGPSVPQSHRMAVTTRGRLGLPAPAEGPCASRAGSSTRRVSPGRGANPLVLGGRRSGSSSFSGPTAHGARQGGDRPRGATLRVTASLTSTASVLAGLEARGLGLYPRGPTRG